MRASMLLTGVTAVVLACLGFAPVPAQDVPGIELCTRESRLDRRTGCLQSNVEFLQQVIAKNALEAREKLGAAGHDVAALKAELAAANRDIAALKEALAAVQARLDALQKANTAAPAPAAASPSATVAPPRTGNPAR